MMRRPDHYQTSMTKRRPLHPSGLRETGSVKRKQSCDILSSLIADFSKEGFATAVSGICCAGVFITDHATHHAKRSTTYRNTVLSLRIADAVGSCAVEPGELTYEDVSDCSESDLGTLLRHPIRCVRVAAFDCALMLRGKYDTSRNYVSTRQTIELPPGDSLTRSRERARHVASLFTLPPGSRILLIGVVNSLIEALSERGYHVIPCDLKGGYTEDGTPIITDFTPLQVDCDAVLATGMTIGNGTIDLILERFKGVPIVLFAQTGSAIAFELFRYGVTAVCSEPFPFFWLSSESGKLHLQTKELCQ